MSCEGSHRNLAEGELEHLNNMEQTRSKVTQQVELSSRIKRLMHRLGRHVEGTLQQHSPSKASELKKASKLPINQKGTRDSRKDGPAESIYRAKDQKAGHRVRLERKRTGRLMQ